MDILGLVHVKIFPEYQFPIHETFHKIRNKIIFRIKHLKQKINNPLLLSLLLSRIEILLKIILNLIPTILKINRKVFLTDIQQIIYVIHSNLTYPVQCTTLLGFFILCIC
jgi:hypothetical protein